MLQQKHLIVLGGDARNIQVMKQAAAQGASVTAIGFSENNLPTDNIQLKNIADTSFETASAILLPVAGIDEQGNIALHDHKEKVPLTPELLTKTPEDCIVFSGATNKTLKQIVKKAKRTLIPIFKRDDVAIANSIPTAEATLQIAMEQTNKTIHGANITVIGFGRIGTTMAHLFHQVGANVTVAARNESDLAKIKTLTYKAIPTSNLIDALKESNIIINTVPALILDKKALNQIKAESVIIDVTSKPGGTDFETAKKLSIETIHALALPGKVAPITAGNIIADVIIKKLI